MGATNIAGPRWVSRGKGVPVFDDCTELELETDQVIALNHFVHIARLDFDSLLPSAVRREQNALLESLCQEQFTCGKHPNECGLEDYITNFSKPMKMSSIIKVASPAAGPPSCRVDSKAVRCFVNDN